MAAQLEILDGNPNWLSDSIVPSTDMMVSPNSSPTLAAVTVSSINVFVYVKVQNSGTVDLGVCPCGALGAWNTSPPFAGFLDNMMGTANTPQGGFTFKITATSDTLSGNGINVGFGHPGSGLRTWAFSPDGRYFAYASAATGNDWSLQIIALQAITRADGSTVAKGATAVSTNGVFASRWNASNFGWGQGSKCVVVAGPSATPGAFIVSIACPEASSPRVYGNLFPNGTNWSFVVSPCGGMVALMPKTVGQGFQLVSTSTAKLTQFKKNNAPVPIQCKGVNPSITTNAHTASGVQVDEGDGTKILVDDPECTFVGGGILVHVDRVKASTLPTANLGVIAVGDSVAGPLALSLAAGKSAWVQVPNTMGWANAGEDHWCLLAQAFTSDATVIPRPWNAQNGMQIPPFPITDINCAQRNISIS